jgi:benzoyl-CoA reductase subunit C
MEEQMAAEDPWKPFREVLASPWEHARAWKENTGRKVIGHLLPDVPEEILHAAGALPVAIGGAGVQVSRAQAHIPGYTCSHAMGALDLGLRGDLAVLDGMVIPYVCDTTRNLFHIWNHCFPDMANEFLRLPKRLDYADARDYLKAEFRRFADAMAKITGRKVGADELAASITLYNKSRAALRQAYERQRSEPSLWTSERVGLLLASALRAPREEHLKWMEGLPWSESSTDNQERVPVYVRGKVWDPPGIMDLFDKLGLLVVEDEMVTGFRSVAKDAELNGDPIEALVNRHFATVPYAGYHLEPSQIVQGFLERVRGTSARGVIFVNPKFCEAAGFDTPDFQKALGQADIPSLILETSSRGGSLEQVRLRLEAFREMIADEAL